jgi:hypothetical protein
MDNQLIAQSYTGPRWSGIGPLGLENLASASSMEIFTSFLSATIGLLTVIAGIYFVILFMLGAIGILASGGDKQALESARKKITTGLIGLVVTISAIFVISLIGYLLGLDILNPFASLGITP